MDCEEITMATYIWSKTAATNGSVDQSIDFAEGMAASAVNDSARALMARVAEYRDDTSGELTTSGTSTAYTLATNQVFDSLAHMDNAELTFVPHTTSGASPTLNVDGLGAKPIRMATGTSIATGALLVGTPYVATYYNTAGEFILKNQMGLADSTLVGNISGSAAAAQPITIGTGFSKSGTTLNAATPPAAVFKKLSIKVTDTTHVTLAADYITVTDGTNFQTLAFNQAINLGTTGAGALDTGTIAIDTWYHIWAIAKADGTTSAIASASSTSPTMPSGYTYKARMGAVQTIHASATLYGTWQLGKNAQYVVGLAQTSHLPSMGTGNSGSVGTPTWTALAVSSFVPPTASQIKVVLGAGIDGANIIAAAPNNSYGSDTSNSGAPMIMTNTNGAFLTSTGKMLLESTNIYWASTGATNYIACMGWEENL
jgi:hypothetical protein